MNQNMQDPLLGPVGSLFPSDILAEYFKDYFEEYNEKQSWEALTTMFNIDRHKNFTNARNVILDYHLRLEREMNRSILFLCILGAKSILTIDGDKFLDAISKIEFGKKIGLVDSLKICSESSLDIINKINNIRIAFAHSNKVDDKRFIYSGESIFLLKGIKKVQTDCITVMNEFYQQFDKMAEQIKK